MAARALLPDGTSKDVPCDLCSVEVGVFWMASGELWSSVSGRVDGHGHICPRCFDRLALERGWFLHWRPIVVLPAPRIVSREAVVQALDTLILRAMQVTHALMSHDDDGTRLDLLCERLDRDQRQTGDLIEHLRQAER